MKNLKAKLRKNGGFTLIEMLIVVAIIAILIAISIPLVATALERAREATDAANERSAIATATIAYLSNEPNGEAATAQGISTNGGAAYYVVAQSGDSDSSSTGSLVATFPTDPYFYGKGTANGDVKEPHTGKLIYVSVAADTGAVTVEWLSAAKTAGP